jgi:N-acetylglutamate synthase-like GNAT family acetyltransferase
MVQKFEVYTSNSKNDLIVDYILKKLIDYNDSQVVRDAKPFVVALKQDGKIIGGAECVSTWDWMHVKLLWVEESERKQGYGTKLLKLIETEAVKRNCTGIHLDTFSFQAKEFYFKFGFNIFGEIHDHPKGHDRYYLKKKINP